MIEPGWTVENADGEEIGRVSEVVGDSSTDIFNGLAISTGLLSKDRYVPAERVDTIVEGTVRLDVTADEASDLEEYDRPPPSEEILPPDRRA
jgi:ribosomal 30S subunit maturation factor RimM